MCETTPGRSYHPALNLPFSLREKGSGNEAKTLQSVYALLLLDRRNCTIVMMKISTNTAQATADE
jgi:hypothetical protein